MPWVLSYLNVFGQTVDLRGCLRGNQEIETASGTWEFNHDMREFVCRGVGVVIVYEYALIFQPWGKDPSALIEFAKVFAALRLEEVVELEIVYRLKL